MRANAVFCDHGEPGQQQYLTRETVVPYEPLFKADNNLIKRQQLGTGRTIDFYNDMIVVADPSVGTLDETHRFALLQEVASQIPPAAFDFETVVARLQHHAEHQDGCNPHHQEQSKALTNAMKIEPFTPHKDKTDVQNRQQRIHNKEARCRERLIDAGCPPCLPENHQYYFAYSATMDTLPYEHPAAMFYLQGGHSVYDRPLDAQLADWTSFRSYQQQIREELLNGDIDPQAALRGYIYSSQEKMYARNWTESAGLINWQLDVSQQDTLQNWLEFMVNHLDDNAGLRLSAQQRLNDAVDEEDREWQREVDERRIDLHANYLVWMETQRVYMSAEISPMTDARNLTSNLLKTVPNRCTNDSTTYGNRGAEIHDLGDIKKPRRSEDLQKDHVTSHDPHNETSVNSSSQTLFKLKKRQHSSAPQTKLTKKPWRRTVRQTGRALYGYFRIHR